jgi:hypothetical protein
MRVRILVTNGSRTIDLYWLHHDGKDVYCGPTKSDHKRSYHRSGKVHSTIEGDRKHEAWCLPLAAIKGQFHLSTTNIGNAQNFVAAAAAKYEYGGGKSDALLVIDSRSIPDDVQANIAIGLIEPGNLEALSRLTANHQIEEGQSISCEQLLLATSVKPWVYAIVFWWKGALN